MMIKVCGMREPDNIRAVAELGVDMIGFVFCKDSPRYVGSISTHAGLIPDMADESLINSAKEPARVGVFVNEMPQTVITHAYNYELDYIQLHGSESGIYIDNLRRTLVPDILPDVKIIKAISVGQAEDVERWHEYDGHADMLLFDTKCEAHGGSGRHFDWSLLAAYDGHLPFLLSGGIRPEDAEAVRSFHHPRCMGIDLNSGFEDEPGVKNLEKLRRFIDEVDTVHS